jgi:PqqD family protein of HPr-rel-A system
MADRVESSASSPRWAATRGDRLTWRSWDEDECVVFSDLSGDTHLVNRVTAEVLRHLERAELDLPELARRVATALGTEPGADFETHLAQLLAHLDAIGLVEPVR